MIPGYSNLRIELNPSRMLLTNSEGIDLQIDQLSGGYKAVLSVVADIAKRLAIANPQSVNPLEEEEKELTEEEVNLYGNCGKDKYRCHNDCIIQFKSLLNSSL